jgi:hypothetical protein
LPCSPALQALSQEAEAYKFLTSAAKVLTLGEVHDAEATLAWLLSADGEWFRCEVRRYGHILWISDPAREIIGKISGSPVLAEDCSAIGVLSCSAGAGVMRAEGVPGPALAQTLPHWLVAELSFTDTE